MAGTTIKGVGNSGNVQIPDMVTAAKQNAGTKFSRRYGIRPRAMPRQLMQPTGTAPRRDGTMSDVVNL